MNMDKYFMWIHYERLHNHNKAKHNKTVCIFLGIYCMQMIACSRRLLNKAHLAFVTEQPSAISSTSDTSIIRHATDVIHFCIFV